MNAKSAAIALLDIRREHDFVAGHAPHAANIPLEELATSSHELPARTALISVTDRDPTRALAAREILARRGNPVEFIPLDSLELSATGPASARLWSPNPFLIEAFKAIACSPSASLSRYRGGGPGRRSSAKGTLPTEEPPPQPSSGLPGEGEIQRPSGMARALDVACGSGRDAVSSGIPGEGETEHQPSGIGRALDVACGSGRDAVWLALQGMQVDAIDHLPDALDRAMLLARRNRVAINAIQKDIEANPTLAAGYDLVCGFRYLHRPLWPALRNAVKPGGYIIYETFHVRTREAGGRPSSPDHLLQTGELAAAFEGFEILDARNAIERDGRYFSCLLARKMPV